MRELLEGIERIDEDDGIKSYSYKPRQVIGWQIGCGQGGSFSNPPSDDAIIERPDTNPAPRRPRYAADWMSNVHHRSISVVK